VRRVTVLGVYPVCPPSGNVALGGGQRELVAPDAESGVGAHGNVREVRGPTERLARGDVRQVELDERDRDREQRVAERDARVRERGRIEQNEIDLLAARGMDAPDQLVLGVALKRVE